MRLLASGTAVQVLATDPGAEDDLRAYCEASGCRFLSAETFPNGILSIVIQKC
jgi:TusA-related sulfurtransferase